MNKHTLIAVLLAGATNPLVASPPSPDYVLLYEDNFSGNAVNEKDWSYRLGRRTGGNINGLNRKENLTVSDGALHIAVRQEMIGGKLENTGGGLISKHQFGYGYYETLSKPFMAGRGIHSAFWQAGGAKPNNRIFEIDSYEIDSKERVGCNNLYIHIAPKEFTEVPWPTRAHVPVKFQPDGWFLDAYEFTPEGVVFYDNEKVVAKAEWDELTAAQAVWLTALNGVGKVEADKLPGETTFRYFRYYARDYPGVNLLPNGNFEYNQDKIDPAMPVAWQQEGTAGAGIIAQGNAARDRYKLRHAKADGAYEIKTSQRLEYIMNGEYELSAMARSSGGQEVARMQVSGIGGRELAADIPAGEQWTRITIPHITVMNHSASIAFISKAKAGQWLEVDDVQFKKPALPGQKPTPPRPFVLVGDPIWRQASSGPIEFTGDEKFYFFSRNVGFGDAISVCFVMNPREKANMSPIARIPRTGQSGWAVQLTDDGGLIFRIGSGENHRDVIAPGAYEADRECRVVCTFEKGVAKIYANGKLLKTESGITQDTRDATAPGRLGSVGEVFEAVGDVIVRAEPANNVPPATRGRKTRNYAGTVRDVRIHNRAMSDEEAAGPEFREK